MATHYADRSSTAFHVLLESLFRRQSGLAHVDTRCFGINAGATVKLAFGADRLRDDHVKIGVLVASVLAASLATVVLRLRNRVYRRICEDEEPDQPARGLP